MYCSLKRNEWLRQKSIVLLVCADSVYFCCITLDVIINTYYVNNCDGLSGEQALNTRVDCLLYSLVVVGINNILCRYILYVWTRYIGTYLGEYY